MHSLRFASSAVAVLLLLPACKSPKPDASAGSAVVARVADGTITADELKARLDEQPPFIRARYTTLERKKEFLDQLVRFELLAQEARRQGLDKDPEVQATFDRLLVQRLLQKHTSTVADAAVSEEDAQKFYKEHLSEFVRPERVRVSQVLLAAAPNDPRREQLRQEAVKLAAEARKREAASERMGFAELVARRSDDVTSRQVGGDLGYMTREELAAQWGQAFAAAAFGLRNIGDISEVATDRGLHVLRLAGRQEALEQRFELVRPRIESRLQMEKRTHSVDTLVASLREKATVEVNDAVLEQVKVESQVSTLPAGGSVPALPQVQPAAQRQAPATAH